MFTWNEVLSPKDGHCVHMHVLFVRLCCIKLGKRITLRKERLQIFMLTSDFIGLCKYTSCFLVDYIIALALIMHVTSCADWLYTKGMHRRLLAFSVSTVQDSSTASLVLLGCEFIIM